MSKSFVKILAVIVVSSSLAIFWHAASMDRPMEEASGMSVPCLTLCITGGDLATAATGADLTPAVAFLLFAFLMAAVSLAPDGKGLFCDLFQKDRHRYLMKTMIMLR